jgi:hypothetical protein
VATNKANGGETVNMTKLDLDPVQAALWEAGMDENEHVTNTYSGRGMMGEQCFGIMCDEGVRQGFTFFAHLAAEQPDVALQLANAVRTDSLGTGMIVYFPGYTLDGFEGGDN